VLSEWVDGATDSRDIESRENLLQDVIGRCRVDEDDVLVVEGDLDLEEIYLCALPDRLHVAGNLEMARVKGLKRLCSTLTVTGDMALYSCDELEELPENLVVGGELTVHCGALASIPRGLRVSGDVDLMSRQDIQFPEDLVLAGGLDLSSCYNLRRLADDLVINGDLRLDSCRKLECLPKRLSVTGLLEISSTPIKFLPSDLQFGGSLYMRYCEKLRHLRMALPSTGACTPLRQDLPIFLGALLLKNPCS